MVGCGCSGMWVWWDVGVRVNILRCEEWNMC